GHAGRRQRAALPRTNGPELGPAPRRSDGGERSARVRWALARGWHLGAPPARRGHPFAGRLAALRSGRAARRQAPCSLRPPPLPSNPALPVPSRLSPAPGPRLLFGVAKSPSPGAHRPRRRGGGCGDRTSRVGGNSATRTPFRIGPLVRGGLPPPL